MRVGRGAGTSIGFYQDRDTEVTRIRFQNPDDPPKKEHDLHLSCGEKIPHRPLPPLLPRHNNPRETKKIQHHAGSILFDQYMPLFQTETKPRPPREVIQRPLFKMTRRWGSHLQIQDGSKKPILLHTIFFNPLPRPLIPTRTAR